jgi:ribosomal protein L37AE/L43A
LETLQLLVVVIGALVLLMLLRRALADITGRRSRAEVLAKMEADARRETQADPGGHICPQCGSGTVFHRYPHIDVWRCEHYPACRGFVKAGKSRRPEFAKRWERSRGRPG